MKVNPETGEVTLTAAEWERVDSALYVALTVYKDDAAKCHAIPDPRMAAQFERQVNQLTALHYEYENS